MNLTDFVRRADELIGLGERASATVELRSPKEHSLMTLYSHAAGAGSLDHKQGDYGVSKGGWRARALPRAELPAMAG